MFGGGTTSSVVFVVCVPSLSVVQPLDCWPDPMALVALTLWGSGASRSRQSLLDETHGCPNKASLEMADGGLGAGQAHEEWRSSQKHGPGLFRYVQAPHVRFRPHSAGAQGALPSNTQGTRSFAANIRDQLSSAENISAATARF